MATMWRTPSGPVAPAARVFIPDHDSTFWNTLQGAMNKAFDEAAVEEGERQASEQLKETGTFEKRSNISLQGRAFNQAAEKQLADKFTLELDEKLMGLELENQTDPEGFKKRWNEEKKNMMQRVPEHLWQRFGQHADNQAMRFTHSITKSKMRADREQETATKLMDIDKASNHLVNAIVAGEPVNRKDGSTTYLAQNKLTSQELMEKITQDIMEMAGQPGGLTKLQASNMVQGIAQQVRKAEYIRGFRQLPGVAAKKAYIEALRNVDMDKLTDLTRKDGFQGDSLSLGDRETLANKLQTELNSGVSANRATISSGVSNLANAQQAIAAGAMDEFAFEPQIQQLEAMGLDPDAGNKLRDGFEDAFFIGTKTNELKTAPKTEQLGWLQEEAEIIKTMQENIGSDPQQLDAWVKKRDRFGAVLKQYNSWRKSVEKDHWQALSTEERSNPNLSHPQKMQMVAERIGVPTSAVNPYTSTQSDALLAIGEAGSPAEMVQNINVMRQQLGNDSFQRMVIDLGGKLPGGMRVAAELNDPVGQQALLRALEDGAPLVDKLKPTQKKQMTSGAKEILEAMADDPTRMEAYEDAYIHLATWYSANGIQDGAARALETLKGNRKVVEINGFKRLVGDHVDEDVINSSMDKILKQLPYMDLDISGVIQSNELAASMITATPHGEGFAVTFMGDGTKRQLRVRADGAVVGLRLNSDGRIDLPDLKPEQREVPQFALRISDEDLDMEPNQDQNNSQELGTNLAKMGELIERSKAAYLVASENNPESVKPDRMANNLAFTETETNTLHAISNRIKTGELPRWTYQYLRRYDQFDPQLGFLSTSDEVADFQGKLESLWSQEKYRIVANPGGLQASPLQALARLIAAVNEDDLEQYE